MKIGVFDSGSGGLTVMRALDRALPNRPFIYLGDHANAPYGNRPAGDIYALTLRGIETLFGLGCGLVIVACNTAAATGLRRLQREWLPVAHPNRRVLGVIVPVVEEITGLPWDAGYQPVEAEPTGTSLRVAVFATQHTVASGAFAGEIHKRAPHIGVYQQACPSLVGLIEQGAPEAALASAVSGYAQALRETMQGEVPDICILGCTHYPLIEPLFRQALPAGTRLLSQPEVTARSLVGYLQRHPEFDGAVGAGRQFLTTGEAQRASEIASRFYGRRVEFERGEWDGGGCAKRHSTGQMEVREE